MSINTKNKNKNKSKNKNKNKSKKISNSDNKVQSFKRFLNIVFIIPVPLVLLLSFIAFPFVGYCLYDTSLALYLKVLSYGLSAYALIVLCIRFPYMWRRSKELIKGDELALVVAVRNFLCRFKYSEMYLYDIEFRAQVALFIGIAINTLYAASRFYDGIKYQSIWFSEIGIYYFTFGIIRFFLAKRVLVSKSIVNRREERHYSLKTYRICGILILMLNISMTYIIIQMIIKNESLKNYTMSEIYFPATYTFYSAFISIYNVIKFRKDKNEILAASKNLNFVGTLMSIFTLQTAMLLTFDNGEVDMRSMNTITGAVVIVFAILTSIFMILKANYKIRMLEENEDI